MSPFEALYGRRCRTPINWSESGERPFFGPNLVKDAEDQVRIIRENLRIAQSRQKTYAIVAVVNSILRLAIMSISRFLHSKVLDVSK